MTRKQTRITFEQARINALMDELAEARAEIARLRKSLNSKLLAQARKDPQ